MSPWIPKLTLNQRLGLAALVLGALAVFANVVPGRTVKVNAKELLTDVARAEDHVAPAELFPVMPHDASADEQAHFEQAGHVARFFGGLPRAAAGPGAEPMPLPAQAAAPQIAPPTLPTGTTSGPRKTREGC
jgi:hypothetical protein